MKLRKEMSCTFSKKFADGSIFSTAFSSAMERTIPDAADQVVEGKKLMKEVVRNLERDIAVAGKVSEHGELVKNVVGTIKRAHKLEKRVEKTEKRLQEFD